ncbi:alpha-L-rhamnosidase [Plantibacter flavus]|uniref:alpha-L-rhamnosidase n=1 Tax=Plantibacter flavus TaxID=150123 RepID=UPI0033961BFE
MTDGTPRRPVVTGLRVGRRRDVAVAAVPDPPLSWTVEAEPGWVGARAVVRLDGVEERELGLHGVLERWPFAPLAPGSEHRLEVRVDGVDGTGSAWSPPLRFVTRFLDAPWSEPFLAHPAPTREAEPFVLRRVVTVPADVVSATLWSTSHGVHQVSINGVDVDDHVLKPGWTSYRDRLTVTGTEVGALLTPGAEDVVTVRVAGGWFTERYGFGETARRHYGEQPAVSLRLELRCADGRMVRVGGDGAWLVDPAPALVESGLYAGETWDLRLEVDCRGDGSEPWLAAAVHPFPADVQVQAADVEPVRVVDERAPVAVWPNPDGTGTIIDFGQNLVGRLRLRLDAPAGTEVILRHAELLQDGELYTRSLRAASATDRFVADGRGPRWVEPEFTFHGFRYAEVRGVPESVGADDVRAVVLQSALRRTGWFSSSDPTLDRLHENVVWSVRGNTLAIPTDCPQRDERLGWTGDAQVFSAAAASLFDVDACFASWLDDLALEQRAAGGVVPTVVPNPLGSFSEVAAAGWGDAVTMVPDVLRDRYGDLAVVRRHAASMLAWVEACAERADPSGLWERGFQYGDWLDPTVSRPDKARTDPGLVATAFHVHSARLAGAALEAAGDHRGAERARALAEQTSRAFRDAYLTPAGRLMSDTPTAYALVLAFDLAPAGRRTVLAERLAGLLRAGGHHLATGFLGTPFVLDALLDHGQERAAERLLFQTACPSWLYPVTQGATTVWERPDAIRPDGSVHPSGMVSLNHCAFGAVADVLHRRIGGLAPAAPGYRRILVRPWFPEALRHASVVHETPFGRAAVAWERVPDGVTVCATVPTGSSAEVRLPDRPVFEVASGTHRWTVLLPTGERPVALGVDDDLARLIDHRGVGALVSAVLREAEPALAEEFDAYIRWVPGRTLRAELAAVAAPPEVVARIEEGLSSLAVPPR